jgi:chromosome segregation and condensation protein ScpB
MELDKKIEGLLFYKGEPMEILEIARVLKESRESVVDAIAKLEESLINRGIALIRKDDSVMFGVNKELSDLIQSIRKEEEKRKICNIIVKMFLIRKLFISYMMYNSA